MTNETIKHQLNHRTIRAFKPTNLSAEQLNTLYSVASHTPTSMFMQQMSIMHITNRPQSEKLVSNRMSAQTVTCSFC